MAEIVCAALLAYLIAVFGRIILSWFPLSPEGFGATIAGFLYMVTDPVLGTLRRYIPPLRLGSVALDLSSIVVIFGISILRSAICA